MSRAAAGLLATALLFVATMPAAAADLPGAGGDCAWVKHSKRVSKKVRRHGKRRRVMRTRVWWSCDPSSEAAPQPASIPVTPAPEPAPEPEPTPEPEPELGHLGVKAQEWSYTLSRPEVAAGQVSIQLQNQGGDPHDLNLQLEGGEGDVERIPVTAPKGQASGTFDLSPGTYRLWCDLPEHDEQGMHAQLVVTAPN